MREDAGTVTLPFSIQHPPQAGQTVQARLRFIRPYSSCDQDQEAVLLDTLLTFAPGVTSTSARLQIINDLDIEPTDTICYALTEITGGAVAPTWYGYIFIQDDESSGLPTNFGESGIWVYPNPANDYLTIDARDTQLENANYSLLDALGRSVLTGNLLSQKQWLDLTGIQSGMYFLELREGGRLLEVRKVLKQ